MNTALSLKIIRSAQKPHSFRYCTSICTERQEQTTITRPLLRDVERMNWLRTKQKITKFVAKVGPVIERVRSLNQLLQRYGRHLSSER